MKKDDHIKYIKSLTELQDKEGKYVSGLVLAAINKLLIAANGNPAKFDAMVKALRGRILKELLVEVRVSQMKAKKLGSDFGKAKLNG